MVQRTDISSPIDAALSTRDQGQHDGWAISRKGNGNMTTDLIAEGADYEEIEGLGEAVEEMSAGESAAEDQGIKVAFKAYREARTGERPPYAPKPGMAWIRRRIRMNAKRPGGNRMVRVRWAMVSPRKWKSLVDSGQVVGTPSGVHGIMDMFANPVVKWGTIGAVAAVGLMVLMRMKKSRSTVMVPATVSTGG